MARGLGETNVSRHDVLEHLPFEVPANLVSDVEDARYAGLDAPRPRREEPLDLANALDPEDLRPNEIREARMPRDERGRTNLEQVLAGLRERATGALEERAPHGSRLGEERAVERTELRDHVRLIVVARKLQLVIRPAAVHLDLKALHCQVPLGGVERIPGCDLLGPGELFARSRRG